MTRQRALVSLVSLLSLPASGCGDTAETGSLAGGDGGTDGLTTASLPEHPTAYSITAALTASQATANTTSLPTQHRFSMLIDWAANSATVGSGGLARQIALVRGNGAWASSEPFTLALGLLRDGTSSGGRPAITFTSVELRRTNTGCLGTATGEYDYQATDILKSVPFNATLACILDKESPVVSLFPAAATDLHPLVLEGLSASELLPASTTAKLGSTAGTVDLTALPAQGNIGVSGFDFSGKALAFGGTYQVQLLPDAMDLAGNRTTVLPSVTTLADPGLFAQDGFEGVVQAYRKGRAEVVDSTMVPIPAGSKALRFSPSGGSGTNWSCDDRFTARLAVPIGAKAVKLSYLTYRPKIRTAGYFSGSLQVAVPNGSVAKYSLTTGTTSVLPSPWTGTLPGSADYWHSNLQQIELPLPPGASEEVIFDVVRPCFHPPTTSDGLVIDDLRVE